MNENRVNFTPVEDASGTQVIVEGRIPKKRNPLIVTGEYMVRALMGIRSVNMTYSTAQGQFLPGFMPQANFMGMSRFNDILAPVYRSFLVMPTGFFDRAASNGWLSSDSLLNTPASYNSRTDFSVRSTVDPSLV